MIGQNSGPASKTVSSFSISRIMTWAHVGPSNICNLIGGSNLGPRHHGQTTQSDWLEPWAQALIIFEVGFRRPNTLGGPGTLDY